MTLESGILITVIISLFGVIGAVLTTQGTRLKNVEDRLSDTQDDNRKLWLWGRSLVDYAYRNSKDDSPPLPAPPILSDGK